MDDHTLDDVFARARALTPEDDGAAARFLAGHRQRAAQRRTVRAGWMSAVLASAAVVTGLLVSHPDTTLPASAAYDAYRSAAGDGW
ncbi:hypothetical protein [Deinococcus sp.]|uniref:hypothetical protein n=1 Tax=Deinococcus sp. TaxID=47478 RepID=UPI00286985F4|nr:hypothetical protein [Deinococcus sp.]